MMNIPLHKQKVHMKGCDMSALVDLFITRIIRAGRALSIPQEWTAYISDHYL